MPWTASSLVMAIREPHTSQRAHHLQPRRVEAASGKPALPARPQPPLPRPQAHSRHPTGRHFVFWADISASGQVGLVFWLPLGLDCSSLSLAGKQSFPCKGSGSQGLPCPPSSVCTSLIRNQEGKGQRLAESCNQDTQLWFRGHCSHGSFPGLTGSVWVWQRES